MADACCDERTDERHAPDTACRAPRRAGSACPFTENDM
ncbi:hypothetical protein BURPS1710A_1670 [Burkholderia pseudomallei 1710a]|uniref:Uncharacterized protein n=1 Tax=Burkholderia pseudomallei 1710a TaxID=320371 RepID=A0A0E1WB40_BURPE|nr:hypothetical protein BURPS1710A_1670 [Burkholderia pseudomallei 1710a]